MYKTAHAIMAALLVLNSALQVNAQPLELEPPQSNSATGSSIAGGKIVKNTSYFSPKPQPVS
jgi:hypothetical protein